MKKVKVGITMGDPSGIGPAVILKALNKLKGIADFTVIGDKWVLGQVKGLKFKCREFKLLDLDNVAHNNFAFGKVKAEYGRASLEYIDAALGLIGKNEIDCLVTGPVSKEAVNKAGISFCGHTEYLAQKTGSSNFVMLLLNKYLKVSLVTWHIPLKAVAGQISKNKICKTVFLTQDCLKKLFLIKEPRIVVCGLNPHASDNGVLGAEENKIIKPVLKMLSRKFKHIAGPKSSDVALLETKEKKYDCAIAMYHDQAMIPLKVLDAPSGVNMTLGLPFVRTSPLHGTAFDIAQDPAIVNPFSLIEAIRIAVKCASNQRNA